MKVLVLAFALAASAQYAVSHSITVGISAEDATQGMTWFINHGAWDQTAAEANQCCLSRTTNTADYPTGFVAKCDGSKKKIADSLSIYDRIIGLIP